jgi:pimeloyl-ACP methyl ester carboxylesterase
LQLRSVLPMKSRPASRGSRSSAPTKPTSSAFRLRDADLEKALLNGDHADLLANYFGDDGYAELAGLASEAAKRSVTRSMDRVLIVPGIMGSKLGVRRPGLIPDDVIWLDPSEILFGTLTDLALGAGGGKKIEPLGVLLLFYLRLRLRLRAQGFNAEFWPYDWRLSVGDNGARMAREIAQMPGKVSLVAHSMGGMVGRAAIKSGARVEKLVMLGTPNQGSFLATQALRAVGDSVRKLGRFDPTHTAEELCEQVFNTFPGLYQLLPAPAKVTAFDLFDLAQWPSGDGARPRAQLLADARKTQSLMAPPDNRFFLIAGVAQKTVTALEKVNDQFVYTETLAGDGTVPLDFARLDGVATWYVEDEHGALPNNATVARATADILRTGQTEALPTEWSPSRSAPRRTFTDRDLRLRVPTGKQKTPPAPAEARELLREFLAPGKPSSADDGTPASRPVTVPGQPPAELRFDGIVVGRRRQHRLDIVLAQGDITDIDTRAIVLGLFREVTPGGAAQAVDERMNGAISEVMTRRMFAGNVGEVFLLPTGRHLLRAEHVLFAGLGMFDRFAMETLQLVAENVIRTLVRTNLEDFATVLLGSNAGNDVPQVLENLLRGFVRGLLDADRTHSFRRITLCARSPEKFAEMRRELYRLAGSPLFADLEVTFDEVILPTAVAASTPTETRGSMTVGIAPANYLMVTEREVRGDDLRYRSSLLTTGGKAAVVTGDKIFSAAALKKLLARVEGRDFRYDTLPAFGQELARLVLAPEVLAVLPKATEPHLAVVHDAAASRIPWETLCVEGRSPALLGGMSRRYLADNLSVAKYLETRRQQPVLEMLLVVNPTLDLNGAEEEGKRITALFGGRPGIRLTRLHGEEATKSRLLSEFRSGKYDLLHYAGHAFFDPVKPSRSGVVCAGEAILSGGDLAGIGSLPNLVVFNACEAGRIRGGVDRNKRELDIERRLERTAGLAEAFLRGGVVNYVGTYWPVGDAAAKIFADTFYDQVLRAQPLGAALLAARQSVDRLRNSVDWADYIHYGDPNFALKQL